LNSINVESMNKLESQAQNFKFKKYSTKNMKQHYIICTRYRGNIVYIVSTNMKRTSIVWQKERRNSSVKVINIEKTKYNFGFFSVPLNLVLHISKCHSLILNFKPKWQIHPSVQHGNNLIWLQGTHTAKTEVIF
jgi:hypothetical protein